MKKEVIQLTANIWRVTSWKKERREKKSLFIREPDAPFELEDRYFCSRDEMGDYQFWLNDQMVLAEKKTAFTQAFYIGENDGIYGLGIHQHQPLNRRNTVCQMIQRNDQVTAVPFFTSTGGYAVLFDTGAYMSIGIDKPCTTEMLDVFDTEEEAPNTIQIYADDADTFTYYVILGETMAEQIAGYRLLTGKSPMFAKWAYGYFQSREHYKTQEELLSIAEEFRRRHIPLDCIVQDWNYWGDLGWNALQWDEKKYPDPKAAIAKLHDMDLKLLISVWPGFGPQTEVCKKLEEMGALLEQKDRENEKWGRVCDPYRTDAADLIWDYMNRNLFSIGVDAWWLDSTEPAFHSDSSRDLLDASPSVQGDNRSWLNTYALRSSRNTYEHQRKTTSDKRVMILTRSGYAGQQANAALTWTGDIRADWAVFKEQIPSLLSFSASGIPYSTTDIGAFFVDYEKGNENPEYREMYTRWFWFGAFSPVFRSHGTSTPREMWFFGEPGTEYFDAQMAASRMRYTLMPYIYASAFDVYQNDATLMRPLVMDFPQDSRVSDITDTYMFGPSLLVHIVTDYKKREASVYLPEGCSWLDFYTGKRYPGGKTVRVAAPLDRTPLFVKEGSILLTAEPAECTARQDDTNVKICLYRGENAHTFWYQDDGDNYSYENGNYVKIPFDWDEITHSLTIGTPEGKPENFELPEKFEVYVNCRYQQTLTYTGEKTRYTL